MPIHHYITVLCRSERRVFLRHINYKLRIALTLRGNLKARCCQRPLYFRPKGFCQMYHHEYNFVFSAMPFELYLLWRQYPWVFGDVICDAKMLTSETVTYSSILTIVAFSVERYALLATPVRPPGTAAPNSHTHILKYACIPCILGTWPSAGL